jgi:hypothetical protein
VAGTKADQEGKDSGLSGVKAENKGGGTSEIKQKATENGETEMSRKGQWAGFEGIKVDKDGKMVEEGKTPAPSKMGNIICEYAGIKFASKLERDYYLRVILPAYRTGEIILFVLQPSFLLSGGIRYRGDFLIVWKSGKAVLVDTKGRQTDVYKMKRRLFNQSFPNFRITEVPAGSF